MPNPHIETLFLAVGDRRYLLAPIASAAFGAATSLIALALGVTVVGALVPLLVALLVALALVSWWLLGYGTKLRTDAEEKIDVAFVADDAGCIRRDIAQINEGGQARATYFRLKISRVGNGSINGCVGYLTSVSKDGQKIFDGEVGALPFARSAADAYSKRIDEGVPQYLDLLHVTNQNKVRVVTQTFNVPWTSFREPGKYALSVTLSTPQGRPVHREVMFNWTGDWLTASMAAA